MENTPRVKEGAMPPPIFSPYKSTGENVMELEGNGALGLQYCSTTQVQEMYTIKKNSLDFPFRNPSEGAVANDSTCEALLTGHDEFNLLRYGRS